MNTLSQVQDTVLTRHDGDQESSRVFINEEWPVEAYNNPIDMNSMVAWAVSTTLRSTVLFLSVGQGTSFTRNSHSRNERNPWHIYQHGEENRALAEHITQQWQQMKVPNGQRKRVDQIAKHIVYEYENGKFIRRPFECDEDGNVRVRIKDLTIWSHPPRDEPLIRVLEENFKTFKQKKGNLCDAAKSVDKIVNNTNIPEDKRAKSLQGQRANVRRIFNEYYQFYREVEAKNLIPTSYQFPTLQLEIAAQVQGAPRDRYGGTFSGVYNAKDGEVHHKFAADIEVQPRSLPSKETVFNDLLQDFGLNYAELFQGHDQ